MGKCVIAGGNCPQTSNKKDKWFCPYWEDNGIVWTNSVTGEEIVVNCAAEISMKTSIEVIRSVSKPVAEIEAVRNELAMGLAQLTEKFRQLVELAEINTQLRLENKEE